MSNLKSVSCGNSFFYREFGTGKHLRQAPFYDNFLTFNWRDENSWIDYGCFIINEKNDLHWKGFDTKTNYMVPLYENNNQVLSSINYTPAKITLKLGLYGVTRWEYAKFYNWLNPLAVDKLIFDYDKNYYYKVKPSNLKEATRYVLGMRDNEYLYYIETSVTFEIQGENCGWSVNSNIWDYEEVSGGWSRKRGTNDKEIPVEQKNWISDLRNPIEIKMTFTGTFQKASDSEFKCLAEWSGGAYSLCSFSLKPFVFAYPVDSISTSLSYNSLNGILTSNEETTYNSNTFLLPSKFEDLPFYKENKNENDIKIYFFFGTEKINFDKETGKWSFISGSGETQRKCYVDINITSMLKTPLI